MITAGGSADDATHTITAYPSRVTAGGIVLLVADTPCVDGLYDALWAVVGPVVLTGQKSRVALLGATTVTGTQVNLEHGPEIRATFDTRDLPLGAWRVTLTLTEVGGGVEPRTYTLESNPIEVLARPFGAGDDVAVTLKRAAVAPTSDQALWVRIRNSTNAIGFDNFSNFIDAVVCGETLDKETRHKLRKVKRRTALPFPNVDRYRLLKAAAEVFLMIHCGVALDDFQDFDPDEESRRLNRDVTELGLEGEMREYLTELSTGDGGFVDTLPYLALIRRKLHDVAIVGAGDDEDRANVCYGILAEKLTNPCFIELLWSYWNDEGRLSQTLNAIAWRFQNRRTAAGDRDPLVNLNVDPLRPLNNLLWGFIQDEGHRLTMVRRAFEYQNGYGLVLAAKPGRPVRPADSRSQFIEAFHHLLKLASVFYLHDDDTTRIADGFGVLNALKETHLLLTQGAHNQYGDMPFASRHEMLMHQWILARPEMRDFLPTRTMVAYPEAWMDRVEAMSRMQGWSDVSVVHFRDLAVYGEQILLSIRFGNWAAVNEPERAANLVRYLRAEVQGYVYAYRAVTGVDLTERSDYSAPSSHLRQRRGTYRG
ncbi:hypothetical protein [Lentzea waywayandensis]|nr:hypothetical protein [Lentzea waywayandensis]